MKTAESLIQEKSFQELTQEELELVMELVEDEQTFNEMKLFFAELDHYKKALQVEPTSAIKSSLDNVFRAKHPGMAVHASTTSIASTNEVTEKRIYPAWWFRIAAMLIVFIGISVFFLLPEKNETAQLAQQLTTNPQTLPEAEILDEKPVQIPEERPAQPLLAENDTPELVADLTIPLAHTETTPPVMAEIASGSSFSHVERGMSADIYVNSDKDLASKSFAQPIAPTVLMQFLEPAF